MTFPIHKINEPLTLPSGLTLRNRLVKAAMAEGLSDHGLPSKELINLYSQWAEGEWGMVITGNVMVDENHTNGPINVIAKDHPESRTRWKQWAEASQKNGTAAIVQISHPGRQSPMGAGKRGRFSKTVAPSAVPLNLGNDLIAWIARSLLFGTPRALTVDEIETLITRFVETAKIVHQAGFKGIEIHAAHGYLLAQFLSPKVNKRTDAYGGTATKRAKFVVDIITRIRNELPKSFTVGMKLNSTDYQGENGIQDMVEHLTLFEKAGIDFLEVSGGTYEDPQMVHGVKNQNISDRTAAREAFFLEAAQSIRQKFPNILLLVTGGFRTRFGMEAALHSQNCDLVGVARPAVLTTNLPKDVVLNEDLSPEDAQFQFGATRLPWIMSKLPMARILGGGAETAYFSKQIKRIVNGLTPIAPPLE